jgi:hypothetical protein
VSLLQSGLPLQTAEPRENQRRRPQGGIHAFSNESGAPARMLILFAPGPPREKYFQELAEIRSSGRTLTDEDWIEVWARHDQYPA